jgi:purine catabolism regulator
MALTVSDLVRRPGLQLSLVAGRQGQDREIRWAHSIDLADPSPFLAGGELVMTTGLSVGDGPEEQDAYVRRLARAKPAALAVDTGTLYEHVPAAIRAAGDELGLPVLRVPRATPFIAITRAVVDGLTASRLSALQDIITTQDALARAAVRSGVDGIARTLNDAMQGTSVVVLGADLRILAAHGEDANHAIATCTAWAEARSRGTVGHQARQVTVDGNRICSLQRIGLEPAVLGYLCVSCVDSLDDSARRLIGHAHLLLSSTLSKPARLVSVEQRLRAAVTVALIGTGVADPDVLEYFGFDARSACVVIVVRGLNDPTTADRRAASMLAATGTSHLMAVVDGDLVVVVSEASTSIGVDVHELLTTTHDPTARTGQSSATTMTSVGVAVDQARVAAQSTGAGQHARFDALDAYTTFLRGRTRGELTLLADVLMPLTCNGRHDLAGEPSLLDSLVAYLNHDCQIESAARALDVHRHTLRSRLARIREVLGVDIDSTQRRAELWTAVRAREVLTHGSRRDERPGANPRVVSRE